MKASKLSCPVCKTNHSLERHDKYHRDYIYTQNGKIKMCSVAIPRLICSSCRRTHAYLPSCIIPHSSYSIFFVLAVLRLYFLKCLTVEKLCEKFLISISTLYHWIKLFRLHKSLWLDVINNAATSEVTFISNLKTKDSFLKRFFHKTGRSFMQTKRYSTRSRLN